MGTHDTKQRETEELQDQQRGTSQVGTHGNAAADHGQGLSDPETRARQQGDRTDPAMPSGTTPLERDLPPINQQR
jgi:hypothetical protein